MSTTLDRTPSLADVIRGMIDNRCQDLHVALPGRVESYANGRAIVKPLIKGSYLDESGTRVSESLPAIPDVPVMFTGGNGISLTVQKGDVVLLVFASKSLDRWSRLGREVDPKDTRCHDLSDAIAIPSLQASRVDNTKALATKADIDALRSYIAGHIHTAPSGGGPTSTPTTPPPNAAGTKKLRAE